MAARDLSSNIHFAQAILPQALAASATSAQIDMQGYDSAAVEVSFGAITDGTLTPSLSHSVDGTTYTDAGTDGYLNSTFAAAKTGAGSGGTNVQKVGYTGPNRYLKVIVAVTSGTTGGLVGANVVQGHPALGSVA